MGDTPLERALVVEPRGEAGSYRGVIDEEWVLAFAPQGGVVAALAARTMATELAHPEQTLRSLSAVFAGVVHAGPVEIDVTVLRRGRTMSQAVATVRNPGRRRRSHRDRGVRRRPARPRVHRPRATAGAATRRVCPSFRDPLPDGVQLDEEWEEPPFWDRIVDCRPANGHPPWEQDWEPTTSERISWYRLDEPPVRDDGSLDPLALVVVADTMPGAVGQKVGPGTDQWFAPSVDLTMHLFGPARPGWLLARNQARRATGGYASTDIELWSARADGDGYDLVAYGTQQMLFTFPG